MTDNFALMRSYMIDLGIPLNKLNINDKVFEIQVLRRGKDHPNMPAANYSFKNYYVDSIESYDRYEDEIKKCCDVLGLRAYISVNVKSKEKLQLQCLKIIADNLAMGELKKPWKIFYKAFGTTVAPEQRWIVDIDFKDLDIIDDVRFVINRCQSGFNNQNVILEVPTKSGMHLITHPFNVKAYKDEIDYIRKEAQWSDDIEIPEIKKNHLTLLYENLA